MSCSRRSRFYVALVVVSLIGLLVPAGLLWAAITDVSRPGLQQVDTAPKKPAAPAPLFMLPIPGLTTVSHPAPASMAIPLGTRLMLKQPASSGAVVQWWGATEVARDDTGSTAECSLNTLGWSHVAVEIAYRGGMVGEQAFDLNVIDIDVADIQIGAINVSAGPLPLDENLTNKQTMAYYFAGSVATVVEIGEAHYRTSVDRPLPLSVVVDPPGVAPLIEWRIDGAARHLGTALEDYRQQEIGTHVVSVGPPGGAQSVQFEIYSVEIISHTNIVDILPEGIPINFEAVTNPPGFEDEITWLSSTKYGTAAPVSGFGPTFTAEFNDTYGPHPQGGSWQWLGVIADNARFGQDKKIIVDSVSPLSGTEGDVLTITGSGFDPDSLNTCVFVGGVARARVIAASSTELTCEIGPVANVQSGDVVVVTGVGELVSEPAGSFPLTEGFSLENGDPTEAQVSFQLVAATSNVFTATFAAENMCISLTGDWDNGDKAIVDLHLFCANTLKFREIVFTKTNTTGGQVTAATMAVQIRASIDGYNGVSATDDGAGKITITKPGGILPTTYVKSTITKK